MTRLPIAILCLTVLQGCVTSTVDEVLYKGPEADLGDASVVILGRRHASDYETEPDFIACVGKHIQSADKDIQVMSELEFMNSLYPWFEPRTAPLRPTDIQRMMDVPAVRDRLAEMNTEYMVWIDGETIRTEGAGSMTCGIGPGGAGLRYLGQRQRIRGHDLGLHGPGGSGPHEHPGLGPVLHARGRGSHPHYRPGKGHRL